LYTKLDGNVVIQTLKRGVYSPGEYAPLIFIQQWVFLFTREVGY